MTESSANHLIKIGAPALARFSSNQCWSGDLRDGLHLIPSSS